MLLPYPEELVNPVNAWAVVPTPEAILNQQAMLIGNAVGIADVFASTASAYWLEEELNL
jgi:hypothetical protein